MKTFRRGVRWAVRTLVPKAFNVVVILGLILQPAGTPGIWNIALAQSTEPVVADAPAPEPAAEPAKEEIKKEEPVPVKEEVVAVPPKEEAVVPPVEKPVVVMEPEVVVPVEEPTPVTTPESEIIVSVAEEVVLPATPAEEPVSVETPVNVVVPPAAEEDTKECFTSGADIQTSTEADWTIDTEEGKAETKEKVALGVAYVFPLDKDVKVTFTCLPKDASKRAPLSIERIKTADIDLPEGVSAAGEYAYGITTDGMDNGDFKYDLVLPRSEVAGAEVKYIEQSANEVVANEVTESELKSVDEKKVEKKTDSVEVSNLDHFTIFIVTTPGNGPVLSTASVNNQTHVNVAPNTPITATLKVTINPNTDWHGVEYKVGSGSWICKDTPNHDASGTYSESFVFNAPSLVGTYDVVFRATNRSDCHNGEWSAKSEEVALDDAITVTVLKPDLMAVKSHTPSGDTMVGQTFTWNVHIVNSGTAAAIFGDDKQIFLDELSSSATYGTPLVSGISGVTGGTVVCSLASGNVICKANGTVTIAPAGAFDISFSVTPTEDGTLTNPRHHGVCVVDPASNKFGNPNHWEYEDTVDESVENNNGCSESIRVIEPPYTETKICHATASPSNPYVEESPNTAGVLMGHVGVGHQNGEDIIPPVPFYLPLGQNWDAEGQAIWENDCEMTGQLKAIKVVDDQSNLTQWSFQLDGTGPIVQANASGVADFGSVSVGPHTLTEIGLASYSITNISGAGCTAVPNSPSALATVAGNSTTTCVFNNAVHRGSITIVKDAQPNDAQDFSFSESLGNFLLDDDADPTLSNSKTVSGLLPGMYIVTENPTPGWTFQNAVCTSNLNSRQVIPGATQDIALAAGENVTCTFTNIRNAYCGDGVKNQEGEECDGKDGSQEGSMCSINCKLIPQYDGPRNCPADKSEKELLNTYVIDAKDADGIMVPVVSGTTYLFEASGTFVSSSGGHKSDAGYTTVNNWGGIVPQYGIHGTGSDYAAHALLGDLGAGVGVIDWGGYNSGHVYSEVYTPGTSYSARFVIGDRYSNWFATPWQNQSGMSDNSGELSLKVYKCQSEPDVQITKTDTPDPVTSGGILTYTLTAKNNGPITATNVIVTDTLPNQFQLMSVTPSIGTCSSTIAPSIQCELGAMVAGATATVTVKGIALGVGSISNTTQVASDNGDTNPANNVDTEATIINEVPGVCLNNTMYANAVMAADQGNLKSGSPIIDPTRVVPSAALGGPDGKFFSLGDDGSLIVKFTQPVIDVVGSDLSFHEVTNGRSGYPLEKADVFVSADNDTFYPIGSVTSEPSDDGVEYLDFSSTGLPSIQYVKIVDTTNFGSHISTADGYDVDAIDAQCGSGTIVVKKETNPDASQESFGFNPSWSLEDFSLTDGQTASFHLASGVYSVAEVLPLPAGWDQTSVSCTSSKEDQENAGQIALQAGETVTCTFTNTRAITVVASKIICDAESYLPNWGGGGTELINADTASSWLNDEEYPERAEHCALADGWNFQWGPINSGNAGDTYTGPAGGSWNTSVPTVAGMTTMTIPGTTNLGGRIEMREVLKENYLAFGDASQSTVSAEFYCTGDTVNYDNWEWINNPVAGQTYYCVAWNVLKTGTITGTKYEDCDGNGEQNIGEEARFSENEEREMCRETGLGGWSIYLDLNNNGKWDEDEPKTVTEKDGTYRFENLIPGDYIVREVDQEGWQQTENSCDAPAFSEEREDARLLESEDGANVLPGATVECPIGNMQTPSLTIEKSNDSTGVQKPGDVVRYHIKVTAHNNDVLGVEVVDLPPAGFTYVGGSALASQGNLSHTYASPGVWSLGNMTAGQTIELAYDTTISDTQDSGDYKDLAYARGVSEAEEPVLADDLLDNDNFVGTNVEVTLAETSPIVVVPEDNEHRIKEKTVKKTKYVLGASTTLPMTGANTGFMALALVLFLVGIGLVMQSRRKKQEEVSLSQTQTMMKSFLTLIFAGVCLLSGQAASAATLGVQIETPEAVVSSPDFKIGFVVLDTDNNTPLVTCQVNAGSGFTNFPAGHIEYVAQPGGNSGNCVVDAAVMPLDGDYVFRVMADTTSSSSVGVKLVSTFPGTPYNYERDDASCMNNITFTTAADAGKTVKVELYRSLSTSFTADALTKVSEQLIGSDSNGSFSMVAPGCSNDSYYALRAVDAYGNGSGFVGDKDVTVHTNTVKHNKTKTVALPGETPSGAIAVSSGNAAAGEVQGAETVNEEATDTTDGAVLGEATESGENQESWISKHPWLAGLAVLVLLALGYTSIKKQRNASQE